jgi:hypothetical protein
MECRSRIELDIRFALFVYGDVPMHFTKSREVGTQDSTVIYFAKNRERQS